MKRESYLLKDNRLSGGQLVEAATFTCTHCQHVVVMNPDRTRARAYCHKCDHIICDNCAAIMHKTLECIPIAKTFDQLQEAAARNLQLGDYTNG